MTPVEHVVAVWLSGTVLCLVLSLVFIGEARDADRPVLARLALTCWAWPLWLLVAAGRRVVWLWRVADFGSLRLRR